MIGQRKSVPRAGKKLITYPLSTGQTLGGGTLFADEDCRGGVLEGFVVQG